MILGIKAKNIVTGEIAPSYTSQSHIWKGTAPTLNKKAVNENIKPNIKKSKLYVLTIVKAWITSNVADPVIL